MALTAKNGSTPRPSWARFAARTEPAVWGPKTYTAIWDDTTDGHITAHATAGMGLGVFIPQDFIVTEVLMDVLVVPIGPTNMSVSLENDGDLITGAAISGAPWSSTGVKVGAQSGVPITTYDAVAVALKVAPVRTTAVREIVIGGTVANSSAGRIVIFVTGHQSFGATQGAPN